MASSKARRAKGGISTGTTPNRISTSFVDLRLHPQGRPAGGAAGLQTIPRAEPRVYAATPAKSITNR